MRIGKSDYMNFKVINLNYLETMLTLRIAAKNYGTKIRVKLSKAIKYRENKM